MNISTLSQAAGVSNATIARFATEIGCEGYAHMQKELQKVLFNYYSSLDEIHYIDRQSTLENYHDEVEAALCNFARQYPNRDKALIESAAGLIGQSEKVFIGGNQISGFFPHYAQYLLSKYRPDVYNVSQLTFEDENMIRQAGGKSCGIVFALPRYPNRTMALVRLFHEAGVPMVIFTDSNLFPYEHFAKYVIYAPSKHLLAFGSLISVFSIMYEIILMVILNDPKLSKEAVSRFDEYVDAHNVYFKMLHGNDYTMKG